MFNPAIYNLMGVVIRFSYKKGKAGVTTVNSYPLDSSSLIVYLETQYYNS